MVLRLQPGIQAGVTHQQKCVMSGCNWRSFSDTLYSDLIRLTHGLAYWSRRDHVWSLLLGPLQIIVLSLRVAQRPM